MSPLTEAHSGSAVSRDLADFHPKRDTRPHAQRSGVDDSSRRRNMRKTEDFPYYAYTICLLILPARTENLRVEALWREKKATRLAIRWSRYENASVFVGFGVGRGPDQRAPVWRCPDGGAQLLAAPEMPGHTSWRTSNPATGYGASPRRRNSAIPSHGSSRTPAPGCSDRRGFVCHLGRRRN